MKTKTNSVVYWTTTGILAVMMLFSAFSYLTNPQIAEGFKKLGFLDYFRVELGIAKIIGVIVLVIPRIPERMKEWAYAGFGIVFISAAILAILIACLGLFGLVMYTTKQRTKEIGIRKVLGASIISIVTLLSGEFIRLVILALIIGLSVGAWGMSKWLEDFEYRTEIGWDILIISSLLAFIIALVTVSWQAFKSAMACLLYTSDAADE